jgi:SAM-dependent methyltransferase
VSRPPSDSGSPRFCDYEGSDYRTAFWEGRGREYEDLAERIALRKLIPPTGERIIDIGGGYGRLADLYKGYKEIVLMDYSRSQLEDGQKRLGPKNILYVAANVYEMPFAPGSFDTGVIVRVLHHLADAPRALQSVQQILRPGATLVMEYANRRNLKAILRYFLRRQTESPFDITPWEFQPLHFNYHPAYVARHLQAAGLRLEKQLAVSQFRVPLLKRLVPPNLLARVDGWLQGPAAAIALSPSIFTRSRKTMDATMASASTLFRCPRCKSAQLVPESDLLVCIQCGCRWSTIGGIYDFRQPLDTPTKSAT